jgi:hypothetical protein
VLGQRIMLQGGSDPAEQVAFAFRLCVSRPPTTDEQQRLLSYYREQLEGFSSDPGSAELLVRIGSADLPVNLDRPRLAAWMMLASVLLNLDETLTKG